MSPARRLGALLAAAALLGGCTSAPTHTAGSAGSARSAAGPQSTPASSSPASPTAAGPPQLSVRRMPWHLPQAESRGAAIPVPGGVLLAGGLLAGDVSTAHSYLVDPGHGRVRRSADLALPAHDVAGATVHGAPTLFGGGGATELADVQRLRHGRWSVVGHLPGARSDLAAVPAAAGADVIGGYDGVHTPTAVLRTSDGRRFRVLGRLPSGVRYAAVAVVGHTAWVLGGEVAGRELRSVYALDLRSGKVIAHGRLPRPVGHAAAAVVGDRVLLMGGRISPDVPTDAMWWFDPASGRFHRAGRLPYPVADAPTFQHGAAAYLLGGETPNFSDRVLRVSWTR
ncbi:MAG: hypothetical protein ACXVXG_06185 [Nocardioidaceae bacterium]